MTVKFLAPARLELVEAIEYYESQRSGQGRRLAEEAGRTLDRILLHPEAWAPLSKRTRRCLTHKFPYGIIYQVRGEVILVVAFMHLHRNPTSWKRRLGITREE